MAPAQGSAVDSDAWSLADARQPAAFARRALRLAHAGNCVVSAHCARARLAGGRAATRDRPLSHGAVRALPQPATRCAGARADRRLPDRVGDRFLASVRHRRADGAAHLAHDRCDRPRDLPALHQSPQAARVDDRRACTRAGALRAARFRLAAQELDHHRALQFSGGAAGEPGRLQPRLAAAAPVVVRAADRARVEHAHDGASTA